MPDAADECAGGEIMGFAGDNGSNSRASFLISMGRAAAIPINVPIDVRPTHARWTKFRTEVW